MNQKPNTDEALLETLYIEMGKAEEGESVSKSLFRQPREQAAREERAYE